MGPWAGKPRITGSYARNRINTQDLFGAAVFRYAEEVFDVWFQWKGSEPRKRRPMYPLIPHESIAASVELVIALVAIAATLFSALWAARI